MVYNQSVVLGVGAVDWVVGIYLEVVVEVLKVSLVGRKLVTVCLLLLCLLCL